MKYLRRVQEFNAMGRIRNSDIRERCGYRRDMFKRLVQSILKWFGYMEI